MNGVLQPRDVAPGSEKRIRLMCPGCPKCGCRHKWRAQVNKLTTGELFYCPFCCNFAGSFCPCKSVANDSRLMREWSVQNFPPDTVNSTTLMKFIWDCSECGSSYKASPFNRVYFGSGCPTCANLRMGPGNLGQLVDVRPDLAEEFDETANTVSVSTLTCGSNFKAVWRCKECSCQWTARVKTRVRQGSGCPQSSCVLLKKQRSRYIPASRMSD